MTLEELIEHRERGSSQLHLAEIFKSSPKAIPEADFDLSPPQPPVTEEPPMLGSFPNSISQEVRTTSWVWYLLMGICFTIPFLPTTDVLTSTFERSLLKILNGKSRDVVFDLLSEINTILFFETQFNNCWHCLTLTILTPCDHIE